MSLAPNPLSLIASSSVSWRRFQKACVLTFGLLVFGLAIYAIEKYSFQPRHRFMESPAEVMMRAFGFAHFLLGWMFLFSSPRLRHPGAKIKLALGTLAGIGACFAFCSLGGGREPLLLVSFYALFLVHEIQDECTLARVSGDIPSVSPFADSLTRCVTLVLVVILAGMYLLRGFMREPDSFGAWSGLGLVGMWAVLAMVTAYAFWSAVQDGRREHETFAAALDANLPLVRIYQSLIVILFLGSLIGSVGLNLVILLHVTVWFVFVLERPERTISAPSSWSWLRYSKAGFVTLHVGLGLLFLFLMALRVHVWLRGGWFNAVLSSSAFPYWTLMHICMAFGARR